MDNINLNSIRESLLNEDGAADQLIDQWFQSQIADLKIALDAKAAAVATADQAGAIPMDGGLVSAPMGMMGAEVPMEPAMAPAAPMAPMAPMAAEPAMAVAAPAVDYSEPTVEPAPVEPEEPVEPEVEEAEVEDVDLAIDDAVEQIESELEDLKSQFLDMLKQAEHPDADAADDAEVEDDDNKEDEAEADADEKESDEEEGEAEEDAEKEETEEAVEEAIVEVEEAEEVDEDYAALEEAYKLKTVTDKLANQEGAQVGEAGKIPVQTKSPVVSKKPKDRVGGEPVMSTGGEAKGFAMEKAPKVTDVKLKDGKPGNAKEEGKKVSKEGDKSAVLNKSQGAENTKSPVGSVKGFKK